MAQLRDYQTSTLLAEGDPRDLILVADAYGIDKVLWDDAPGLSPDALRENNAMQLDLLKGGAITKEKNRRKHLEDLAADVARVAESEQELAPVIVSR